MSGDDHKITVVDKMPLSELERQFTVIAKPHPLKSERVIHYAPVGVTLSQLLGDADDTVEVSIEGEFIPREMWDRLHPKTNVQIHVTRYPRGRTIRKVVVIVLLILIYIYAPYLAPYLTSLGMAATTATIVAGALTMLAVMAVMSLMPPPELPKMSSSDGAEFSRLNAITGTSNANIPYGTIPMVIGECRYYPPFAAMPYTEILGDQQYLRMLLDLGYGDLVISDIRIGETLIGDFADVAYEISTAPALFSNDIFELGLVDAFNTSDIVTKTTQTNTDEISTDIIFPSGLFGANDKSQTTTATTSFTVEFQPLAGGAWVNVATLSPVLSSPVMSVSGSTILVVSRERKTLRLGLRWVVTKGQYNVRWTRNATTYGVGTNAAAKFEVAQLSTLRSIRYTSPSSTGTLKLALRIKATDQLNGVINQLSVLGQQKIPVYDETTSTWLAPEANLNPAWIYNWLLTSCPGVAQHVDASRVDLDTLKEFADANTSKGFTARGMIDKAVTSGDLYKLILSAGRGSFAMRDGMYSVLIDRNDTVPIQHFSPANSSGFSGSRVFIDIPHALRVQFQNSELNWQQDEIIVLRDGYSYNGLGPRGLASADPVATKFETLPVPYVTSPISAWQIARYHIAQAVYRSNSYQFNAGLENLVCTRGDMIYMTHDVTEWGAGFGLITGVTRDGSSQVTVIQTSEPLLVEAGQTYSIRVRDKTGVSTISNITGLTVGLEYTTFPLATPLPVAVSEGDLYLLGNTESAIRKLLITRISPAADFEAAIMAVEYSALVDAYDDNPPATFISAITGTLILEPPDPPSIYAIFSSEYAQPPNSDGGNNPVINIGIDPGPSRNTHPGPPWRNFNNFHQL